MKNKPNPIQGRILALIMVILVSGSLFLAVIDEDSRPAFADLVKVGLGGYIGLLMPRDK